LQIRIEYAILEITEKNTYNIYIYIINILRVRTTYIVHIFQYRDTNMESVLFLLSSEGYY